MITIGSLNAFGANTEEGLARCMGNEALSKSVRSPMAAIKALTIQMFTSNGSIKSLKQSAGNIRI